MPRLSSLDLKNISAAKMNKKYDSCAAHITRVATNVDFWTIWSGFLSKLKHLRWIFIEIEHFLTVYKVLIFRFRRTKKMIYPPPAAGRMNTRLRWVRIHNREERLFRASKRICPKMRPHLVRRRQQHPRRRHDSPKVFPSSRKFSRIVSDIFVSQAMVHK